MRRLIFFGLLSAAIALLMWAVCTTDKAGLFIFFLGSLTLICAVVVGPRRHAQRTNTPAIACALIGLLLGGVVGEKIGLGRAMITVFNPDLPEQDFGATFGAIGGGILGAFVFALLGGILHMLIVRRGGSVREHPGNRS
jgi:hypothetical protein